MGKQFTKMQQESIRQCLLDADIMGLSVEESIAYVRSRIGTDFSPTSYKRYRNEFLKGDSNARWISYYARQGFVDFYRKRIAEMEMIQKNTFQQWLIETNRPDAQKDKNLIIKLIAELRANNQQLTSLGMVTPIIATIKNLIDKDKIDNASKFIHPSNKYQVCRTDADSRGIEDTNATTTTTTAISDMVSRELDDLEEDCTTT